MSTQTPNPTPDPKPPVQQAAASDASSPLSAEDLKKLHDRLREQMSTSRLKVIAPAGWIPYWARKNDEGELARLDWKEFRIVREVMDGGKTPKRYKAQGLNADGTYSMGDVVLMEIRQEVYDFYQAENTKRSTQMSQAAKDKFVEDAGKQGAPTFVVNRGT